LSVRLSVRLSPVFLNVFPNAVWGFMSGAYRIESDTVVMLRTRRERYNMRLFCPSVAYIAKN